MSMQLCAITIQLTKCIPNNFLGHKDFLDNITLVNEINYIMFCTL